MSCDNNQPKPFLPVIPDPYDSLTDGIEQFEKANGGAAQTFGALGKLAGPVNNYASLAINGMAINGVRHDLFPGVCK